MLRTICISNVLPPDLSFDTWALIPNYHSLALPRSDHAVLACPFGKQASLSLKLLDTLNENMGLTDLGSHPTKHPTSNFKASWTLTPSQPSILTHKFEGNTKFAN